MDNQPIHFSQEIALFPLPNCVLFPGVVQPLHIFEPRYRRMMADVVSEDGQSALAMALLKPGWEKSYYASPPIHDVLCVGRVIAHEHLDDGKYNLLLQGIARARVKAESKRSGEWGAYRVGLLEPVPEPAALSVAHEALQKKVLRELFEKTALKDLTVTPALASLFDDQVPMGRLVDALAFTLIQDIEAKQRLLEQVDVALRGELLLRELVALAGRLGPASATISWPPAPGLN